MNKRFLLFVIVLAIAGGAGWYYWNKKQTESAGKEQAALAQMMAAMSKPAVSVEEIKTQKIANTLSLPGRISAFAQAQIRPQVTGIITERLFEEGTVVEKGQQLYQIDDKSYIAALASAQADLKSAEANVKSVKARANRYRSLVKIEAVSRQEYDDVKAQLDQANAAIAVAQAAVDVTKVNLDYTKVYAPISGRIGRSLVTEGTLVTANQSQNLAIITQLDQVYVDMQQSGQDATLLRSMMAGGSQVPVTIDIEETDNGSAIPYPEKGTLKFSEVTIDETTGSVTLRAIVPNPNGLLLPGLFVRTTLSLGEQDALLVPQRATTRTPNGSLAVWVLGQGNVAQQQIIKTQDTYNDSWIVKEGVSPGQVVIVEGYQKLNSGMQVTPSFPQEQPKAQ